MKSLQSQADHLYRGCIAAIFFSGIFCLSSAAPIFTSSSSSSSSLLSPDVSSDLLFSSVDQFNRTGSRRNIRSSSSSVGQTSPHHDLMASAPYFSSFGYLPVSVAGADRTSSEIADAVRRFQRIHHLPISGTICSHTRRKMESPRCGVSDSNLVEKYSNAQSFVLAPSKWMKSNNVVKYGIVNWTPDISDYEVNRTAAEAFRMWQEVSKLSFVQTTPQDPAMDIAISFRRLDHGDGFSFDGPGRTLAHAFSPGDGIGGDVHFDDDETFSVRSAQGINLLVVAVHEIGHALGIQHSDIQGSIMYPWYPGYSPNMTLQPDDIAAIQTIYGPPTTRPATRPTPLTTRTTTRPTTRATTPTTKTTTRPTTRATTPTTRTTTRPTTRATTPTTRTTTRLTTRATTTTVRPITQTTTRRTTTTVRSTTTRRPTTSSPTTRPTLTTSRTTMRMPGYPQYATSRTVDRTLAPNTSPIRATSTARITAHRMTENAARRTSSNFPSNDGRKNCITTLDAAANIGNEVLVFKRKQFWRLNSHGVITSGATEISHIWIDRPSTFSHIDAAFGRPDNGNTVFVIGDRYYELIGTRLANNFPPHGRPLTDLNIFLPPTRRIDAALVWGSTPGEKHVYLLSGSEYYRLSFGHGQTMRLDVSDRYPKAITTRWPYIRSPVDAAFSNSDGSVYFFQGTIYWHVGTSNTARAYTPRMISDTWQFCQGGHLQRQSHYQQTLERSNHRRSRHPRDMRIIDHVVN